MPDRVSHWEAVYASRRTQEVSWYQIRPETSLRLMAQLGIQSDDPVIDVGGGASTLVDHLLDRGYSRVTVLDIAASALAAVQERLGPGAARVIWLTGDITRLTLPGPYRLWHDRAVFHFLTEAADRQAYLAALYAAVPIGGFVILATFADDGPERCSNLPVCRYSPEQLAAEVGPGFTMIAATRETHYTPAQKEQKFSYAGFRRG